MHYCGPIAIFVFSVQAAPLRPSVLVCLEPMYSEDHFEDQQSKEYFSELTVKYDPIDKSTENLDTVFLVVLFTSRFFGDFLYYRWNITLSVSTV